MLHIVQVLCNERGQPSGAVSISSPNQDVEVLLLKIIEDIFHQARCLLWTVRRRGSDPKPSDAPSLVSSHINTRNRGELWVHAQLIVARSFILIGSTTHGDEQEQKHVSPMHGKILDTNFGLFSQRRV